MSCRKHIQRKRPNSCPDCAAELSGEKVQTSREMLADLDKIEHEEAELVIKKERKKRVVENIVPTITPVVKEVENILIDNVKKMVKDIRQTEEYAQCKEELIQFIQSETEKALAKVKEQVDRICRVTYECKRVPLSKFKVSMIDEMSRDGWQYMDYYDDKSAILYVEKEGFVLFQKPVGGKIRL